MKEGAWNDEEIGFEGAEAEAFEGQGEILGWCCLWNLEQETNEVKRPEIKIAHTLP